MTLWQYYFMYMGRPSILHVHLILRMLLPKLPEQGLLMCCVAQSYQGEVVFQMQFDEGGDEGGMVEE